MIVARVSKYVAISSIFTESRNHVDKAAYSQLEDDCHVSGISDEDGSDHHLAYMHNINFQT